MLAAVVFAVTLQQTQTVRVFVVSYFPVVGDQIDQSATSDVGGSYADLKAKTERLTNEACKALEEGSRFRGYKLDSRPALRYEVAGVREFKEAIPLRPKRGDDPPFPDYSAIMDRIDARSRVEKDGVQEV